MSLLRFNEINWKSTYGISRLFAFTLAHHGQVHKNSLVDTHRIDLEDLMPFARILRALDNFDFG